MLLLLLLLLQSWTLSRVLKLLKQVSRIWTLMWNIDTLTNIVLSPVKKWGTKSSHQVWCRQPAIAPHPRSHGLPPLLSGQRWEECRWTPLAPYFKETHSLVSWPPVGPVRSAAVHRSLNWDVFPKQKKRASEGMQANRNWFVEHKHGRVHAEERNKSCGVGGKTLFHSFLSFSSRTQKPGFHFY